MIFHACLDKCVVFSRKRRGFGGFSFQMVPCNFIGEIGQIQCLW